MDLSFKQMLTCDSARAPCNPSFSSFKLISLSPYRSCVIAKCKPSDMKKRERKGKKKDTHLLPGLYLYIILAAPSVHFRE